MTDFNFTKFHASNYKHLDCHIGSFKLTEEPNGPLRPVSPLGPLGPNGPRPVARGGAYGAWAPPFEMTMPILS